MRFRSVLSVLKVAGTFQVPSACDLRLRLADNSVRHTECACYFELFPRSQAEPRDEKH